ncbi:MAG: hypothetical protein WCI52_02930 [bacterium]
MKREDTKRGQGGFIHIILLIIVILVILYYLNIPLQKILSTDTAITIATTLKGIILALWQDVLILIQFVKDIIAGK